MAKLSVSAYLDQLKTTSAAFLVEHCTKLLNQHSLVSEIKKEVRYVIKSMTSLHEFNKAQDRFESEYLRRVIKKFRTEVDIQSLELMILELILLHALNEYQIKSAKVPAIIKLHRDKPLIRPNAMVRINSAAKLIEILEREQRHPTVQENPDALVGRLLLHLFFKEQVEKPEYALRLILSSPRLEYLDGIVSIEVNEPDLHYRCVLSEPGAIWWLHWLSVKHLILLDPEIKSGYYISAYLRSLTDWQYSSVSIPTLKLLRKTDLSLRISPIHYAYVTNFFKSAFLRQSAFLRILTDKRVKQDSGNPDTQSMMTVREKRSWKEQFFIERYTPVQEQLMELDKMLRLLKPSAERHLNGRLGVSRNELISLFTQWLSQNKDTYSPYLWLLMAWVKSLLTDGGQVKRVLEPRTIIDYVSSIGSVFLSIFCQYKIESLDPEDWIDLLDEVSQQINSSHRKCFVIYLASYLRDSGLVSDLAVGELDIAASHGQVDANVVSPHHIDQIIQFLMKQDGKIYRDAILLLSLCYFSGLRRNEAGYIQLSDFTFAIDTSGPVDMYVRPNVKRGIKSKAARRILPLDVLWPSDYLSLLRERVSYCREQAVKPTRSLFEDKRQVERAFWLITDLLHHVTGDQTLRVHHLRHSFANWQWFRLNSSALSQARLQLTLFNHELFSAELVNKFHARLGLNPVSRKSMYVLCHLLGHKEPSSVIASYLHLKELAGYLLLSAKATIEDKQLTQTLGRTKVSQRSDCAENLALRLTFESRKLENKAAPVPFGKDLPQAPAILHDYVIQPDIQRVASERSLLNWAGILMACRKLTPEQVAENEGIHPGVIRRLINAAEIIQKACSGRGKLLPLIPNLAPWIVRLRQPQKPIVTDNNKRPKVSHSLIVLRLLLSRIQDLLDQGKLSWETIRESCYILKYVVPGKGYVIRSPNIQRTSRFFELLHQIGLKARHLRLTLFLDHEDQSPANEQKWHTTLQQCSIDKLHAEIDNSSERQYFSSKYHSWGVLQIALMNTRLSGKPRRQRVFMSAFQLLAILSVFVSEE